MKPKNLKFPFTWEERRPAFHQGVLIVPQFFQDHKSWEDDQKIFTGDQPHHVEFCSGNGDWVIAKAKQYPEQKWIAVEKQFSRVRKIWSKMKNEGIENLLIVCGDGLSFAQHYLPKDSLIAAYVNFPDPWPKDRHAKHRIIQPSFVSELSTKMQPGGILICATDHERYCAQMIEVTLQCDLWMSRFPAPHYTHDWENYGESWFKALWQSKGKSIYYMQFRKT